jgi:hypothetical protein
MITTQTRSQPEYTCAPATFTAGCCCPFHMAWALPMGMGAAPTPPPTSGPKPSFTDGTLKDLSSFASRGDAATRDLYDVMDPGQLLVIRGATVIPVRGERRLPAHDVLMRDGRMGAAARTLDGDAVPFARFAATDQPTGTDFWRERELTQRPMYLAGWTPEVEAYAGIDLERSRAAILLIYGSAHKLWPSSIASERAVRRLRSKNYGSPYKSVAYEGAGHRVTGPSGIDFGQSDGAFHPVIKAWVPLGGSPKANAEASLAAFREACEWLGVHAIQ